MGGATAILYSDTMGKILEHWRISIAVVFSVVLIIGAYIFARGIGSPQAAQASTETALLQAISTKDSTGDGLPDWEKLLYGIPLDAATTDYFNLGMTDGEAVARGLIVPKAIADVQVATSSSETMSTDGSAPPAAAEGSITDIFAKNFFTLYVDAKAANNGADLSQDQISAIEQQLVNELSSGISPTPDFKSKSDIKVAGAGADALRAYAEQAEDVLRVQSVQLPKSEFQYLQDVVQNNDYSALDNLNKIATAYRTTATGLAVLTVPQELADTHLALINTIARIGDESSDFARVKTDPIATMFAIKQYSNSVNTLAQVFKDIASIYASEQVTMTKGTPGAWFVNVISNTKLKRQNKQP